MKIDNLIKLAIAGLFCVLGWIIVGSMRDRVIDVGDTAPNFTVTTDQGNRITPTSFGGRVLVLNFWGTWCAPCVEEVPSLNEFAKQMASSGVVVVGVSVDKNENLYKKFLKRFNVAFQTARDPEADIAGDYGTFKYPETYIIDKSGKVVQKVIGPRNWNDPELMSFIKSL
jgi:peroxiredoxin